MVCLGDRGVDDKVRTSQAEGSLDVILDSQARKLELVGGLGYSSFQEVDPADELDIGVGGDHACPGSAHAPSADQHGSQSAHDAESGRAAESVRAGESVRATLK